MTGETIACQHLCPFIFCGFCPPPAESEIAKSCSVGSPAMPPLPSSPPKAIRLNRYTNEGLRKNLKTRKKTRRPPGLKRGSCSSFLVSKHVASRLPSQSHPGSTQALSRLETGFYLFFSIVIFPLKKLLCIICPESTNLPKHTYTSTPELLTSIVVTCTSASFNHFNVLVIPSSL